MVDIRYAQIRECDISNGEGIGVSLFVQGCNFHCKNCFNSETWDFNGGKEWTREVEDKFILLASRSYIQRISILGGEPLSDENLDSVLKLINEIRLSFPKKSIWLYSGYTWENLMNAPINGMTKEGLCNYKRREILKKVDVLVDGRFEMDKLDLTLPYRGSSNQRIILVQKSLQNKEIVLYKI